MSLREKWNTTNRNMLDIYPEKKTTLSFEGRLFKDVGDVRYMIRYTIPKTLDSFRVLQQCLGDSATSSILHNPEQDKSFQHLINKQDTPEAANLEALKVIKSIFDIEIVTLSQK